MERDGRGDGVGTVDGRRNEVKRVCDLVRHDYSNVPVTDPSISSPPLGGQHKCSRLYSIARDQGHQNDTLGQVLLPA